MPQKKILIIERSAEGGFYSYFEDVDHFAVLTHNGEHDPAKRVETDFFAHECSLEHILDCDQWTSFLVTI